MSQITEEEYLKNAKAMFQKIGGEQANELILYKTENYEEEQLEGSITTLINIVETETMEIAKELKIDTSKVIEISNSFASLKENTSKLEEAELKLRDYQEDKNPQLKTDRIKKEGELLKKEKAEKEKKEKNALIAKHLENLNITDKDEKKPIRMELKKLNLDEVKKLLKGK